MSAEIDSTTPSDTDQFPPPSQSYFQVPECMLNLNQLGMSIKNYLEYCVVRNPADLKSHVRRVILHGLAGDRENLYGALIDLHIILGRKGEALRSRLVTCCSRQLSENQIRALSQCSDTDAAIHELSLCNTSLLSKGIIGTCELVVPVADSKTGRGVVDVLREARECIEYSQIDAARDILERAVMENPDWTELQDELLGIYRASRDLVNYRKTTECLQSAGKPLSGDWLAVSELLTGQV